MSEEVPEAVLVTRKVVATMRSEHPDATNIGPFISYKEDGKWISSGQVETNGKIFFYKVEVKKTEITILVKNEWKPDGTSL